MVNPKHPHEKGFYFINTGKNIEKDRGHVFTLVLVG